MTPGNVVIIGNDMDCERFSFATKKDDCPIVHKTPAINAGKATDELTYGLFFLKLITIFFLCKNKKKKKLTLLFHK